MSAALLQVILNGAFSLIAMLRRQGMTNEDINARFDIVDAGGQAISVAEVQQSLDRWQQALDAADQIT